MAELLACKKRMHARHCSSATKTMIGQAYEALEDAETNLSKLKQQRVALEEKMELLRRLDEEIIDSPRKTTSLKK